MGMDICGRNPTEECGVYFRNTVWWWHPLAVYCITVAPDICAACKHWHTNDGDGLDAAPLPQLALRQRQPPVRQVDGRRLADNRHEMRRKGAGCLPLYNQGGPHEPSP